MSDYQGKRFRQAGQKEGATARGANPAAADYGHGQGAVGVAPAYRPSSYGKRDAGRSDGGRRGRSGKSDRDGKRPSRARLIVSRILVVIGVVLLLIALGIFIYAQVGYHLAKSTYDNLAENVTITDSDASGIPVVDWDALAKESSSIVGWIYIPGTTINYPVVQGETNDQYLRALPDGTYNNNGSIMLDADQEAPGMIGQQTTIYGHHMTDGSMFDPIEAALDQDAFDKITEVYYLTPDATYRLTPLFVARVPDTYVEARQENFGSQEEFTAYLTDLYTNARAAASDVDERIDSATQVLTLSTCTGIAPADHRAIMVCTLTETIPTSSTSGASTGDAGESGASAATSTASAQATSA